MDGARLHVKSRSLPERPGGGVATFLRAGASSDLLCPPSACFAFGSILFAKKIHFNVVGFENGVSLVRRRRAPPPYATAPPPVLVQL